MNPADKNLDFPDALNFYYQLMAESPCTHGVGTPIITRPITCLQFTDAVKSFHNTYGQSSGTLDLYPTKVRVHDDLVALFESYANQSTFALVFHYGLENDKLVYITGKGRLDSNPNGNDDQVSRTCFDPGENGIPFPHYLLVKEQAGKALHAIDTTFFDILTRNYSEGMQHDGSPLNPTHTRMAYHNPDRLKQFLEWSTATNKYLYICHGAVIDPNADDQLRHTPCFVLGDSDKFFRLDNEPENPSNIFINKALDAGRLCPPHCRWS